MIFPRRELRNRSRKLIAKLLSIVKSQGSTFFAALKICIDAVQAVSSEADIRE
jgi:hypothetical protein